MTDDIWTVRRILEWIEGYLGKHEDAQPRVSAQWLVSEALGLTRMQLFLDLDRPLTSQEREVLRDYTRRRAAGEPLQYITGSVDFRHIQVKVRKGVLIPRPETEVLVSEALALLPAAPKPQDELDARMLEQMEQLGILAATDENGLEPNDLPGLAMRADEASAQDEKKLLVADLCTGSGCIACSIAYEHPETKVIATDISPEAVSLACENVQALQLAGRVHVLECDLGSAVDRQYMGAFDLVVSNPPYVPTAVLHDIPREVAEFEPELALDGGEDGLEVFKRLLAWSGEALKPGGGFAFELHETCLDQAASLAQASGFEEIRIVRDLAGRPRVLTGRKGLDKVL